MIAAVRSLAYIQLSRRRFNRRALGRLAAQGTLALARGLALALHSGGDSRRRCGNHHLLLYDGPSGASILASEGGELVQILSTMMLAKQPYTLLKGAVYIHPTLAEGFFWLMEDVRPAN